MAQIEEEKKKLTWKERRAQLKAMAKQLGLGTPAHDEVSEALHKKLSRISPEKLLRVIH